MRTAGARLGIAASVVLAGALAVPRTASATDNVLKPYVFLILDTSGSMTEATNSGPPSCGDTDSKLHHAICAINDIVNSFGDIVFGFGRFRAIPTGTTTQATFPSGCGFTNLTCTQNDDMLELLTPLLDGDHDAATWT